MASVPSADETFDGPEVTRLLELHKSLVEIDSTSGTKANCTKLLAKYLESRGFTVETQHVKGEQENILAYVPGSRENRVLVTSHIDTVPPYLPYERRGDYIYGRGVVDAKGCIATQVMAVESLLGDGQISPGDVAMLFVVHEEDSGDGMKAANNLGLSWQSVIFGEPTQLKLARGHKGIMSFWLRAHGKAGHSSRPESGRNAIDILIRAIRAIDGLELPSDDQPGPCTVNLGIIEGGVADNVIPDAAAAKFLIRISAGTPEEIQDIVRKAVAAVTSDVDVTFGNGLGGVLLDHDVDGFEKIVVTYGTDIPHLH
ncbi:hypothetical protein LCI18_003663 [Fusarium solani-melongenae]|uniref:Uncharacterized protein n=1 Tax=Fusarium solani subsp. cucurbitae TaxID=2747967 RepID=A0ACD3YV52_FUSSC|nr:hypothetical protein LCI18_003663 [Fusarium solani-melongenae]